METPRLPSAAHTHQASRPPRDTDCPQGKERPPGTRDGTTLPSAVRPAPRPAPPPGSWGAAWLPHGSQPTGSGGHSSGRCSHRQQKAKPPAVAPRAEHFLCLTAAPGSPARHAAAASVRSSVRSGLGAAGPTTLSSGGGSGARPCTPHGNRAAALSPGPSGARRDSWVRGRSAPLECFRGWRPGSRPFQSDLCNFNSNLKQVRHVLGHIQVLPQPQGLRGGERPPRACPAALLVCRGRGQAPVQELVAVLTLGLQHWEAPHPAWASSGPWGGQPATGSPGAARPAVFRHPGAAELSLAGRGPGARCHGGPGPGISNGKPARRDGRGPPRWFPAK